MRTIGWYAACTMRAIRRRVALSRMQSSGTCWRHRASRKTLRRRGRRRADRWACRLFPLVLRRQRRRTLVHLAACAEAELKLGSRLAVAGEAEGAEVVEIALASALGDWEDVVGVPERSSAGDGLHAVEREPRGAGWTSTPLEGVVDGDGVGVAESADAVVASEDLVAEVAGV